MKRIRAFVPYSFFKGLYPFNMELLDSNALALRACGAKPQDGSVLRSKEYILFGNGIGTVLPWENTASGLDTAKDGFTADFAEERDTRGIPYWKVQCVPGQQEAAPFWKLCVKPWPPDPDDEGHIIDLLEKPGSPGQYIFLSCTA